MHTTTRSLFFATGSRAIGRNFRYVFPPLMATPRLAIVSIVRNEADIIETFVRHHAGMATRMVFVLHRCIDNTREILERLQAEGLPVEIHEHTDPAYPGPEVLREKIARLVADHATEWMTALDADEFLTTGEGRGIPEALAALTSDRVYTLSRKTYVPTPEDDAAESNPVRRMVQRRTAEQPGAHCMLIPVSLLQSAPWSLSQDRQTIVRSETGEPLPMLAAAAISVAHFPVRTGEQFTAKILGGWVALAPHPGLDPRRSAQWHSLVERCTSGRPLTLGELRNIALRYGMPEGTIGIPGLVYDPVTTTTHRPQFLVRSAHPNAVLVDSAVAYAKRTGGNASAVTNTLHPFLKLSTRLSDAADRLCSALREIQSDQVLFRGVDPETGSMACALLLLSAIAAHGEPLTGSALSRRQKLGTLIAPVPPHWQWIRTMLLANKLPLALESALQELTQLLQAEDLAALRQQCRKESASDDLVLQASQMLTKHLRKDIPVTVGTFLAQAAHTLLIEEADVAQGMADPRVHAIHLGAARGEIAGEVLRRMVNAGIERGANPDVLRRDILSRTILQEPSALLQSILTIRMSVLLQVLRMPLGEGETLPVCVGHSDARDAESIPVLCAALQDDVTPLSPEAEDLLRQYLRVTTRNHMEQDAGMSPGLRGIARIHALLKKQKTGLGAVIAPRALLHGFVGSGMREALLLDFEQIRILDLHGNPGEAEDDEPIDGADFSGMCILLLLRAPHAAQKTLFMEWKGLKLQKYHAMLSRGVLDLPWKVIAPEKPGYAFVGT